MKKIIVFTLVFVALAVSCNFNVLTWTNSDNADTIQIKRYDRVQSRYLTTGDFAALQEMNTIYTKETRALIEDVVKLGSVADDNINKHLLEFFRDSTLQNVIFAAESEFADISDLNDELRSAFTILQDQFPGLKVPKFYAQISAFNESIIVDDNDVGISLDKYLGSDYPAYLRFYDAEQRKTMTRRYIVPDCIVFYLWSVYTPQNLNGISQYERDMQIAKFMWIADFVTKKHIFDTPYTDKVGADMRKHPRTTLAELLEINDFDQF